MKGFIQKLKYEDKIFIQTHNFPDHDAVASAFGFQQLLKNYNINACIVCDMDIQRDSLKTIIKDLNIDIKHIDEYEVYPQDKIILVDGCKGNKNMTDLAGHEIGVIDHHQFVSPDDVEFSDIRAEYGACASIIASYYFDLGIPIPEKVATALMIGISLDTYYLTRGVSKHDLKAYFQCFSIADSNYVNLILINNIQIDDLQYYRFMLNNLEFHDQFAFCYFPDGCSQNLLGILANFILAIDGIDFVTLCAQNENSIIFSLRSEVERWNASYIVQEILKGLGFGGGHSEMAGGVIMDGSNFDEKVILKNILKIIQN